MKADLPANEAARLDALRSYRILDTPPETSYDDITQLASEICAAPIALVSLVDSDRQWFKSKRGLEVSETSRDVAFCAHAILQPDLLIVADAREDQRFASNPLVIAEPHIRFYAGAPLVTSQGEALGTVCVLDRVPRTLTEAQQSSLRALARQVMAQLELRRHVAAQERYQQRLEEYQRTLEEANARLEAETVTDDVSGFHNSRFLHRYLDGYFGQVNTGRSQMSLVFFDMDDFKEVVDAHGHLLGAKVLREVAEVIHRHLESRDRIVRYGGDEYVVILPGQGQHEALVKVERMKEGINSGLFLEEEGIGVRITASFGVATFPEDASDKRQLLAEADRCLFQSKEGGKNRITVKSAHQRRGSRRAVTSERRGATGSVRMFPGLCGPTIRRSCQAAASNQLTPALREPYRGRRKRVWSGESAASGGRALTAKKQRERMQQVFEEFCEWGSVGGVFSRPMNVWRQSGACRYAVGLMVVLVAAVSFGDARALGPGDVLDQRTWQEAEGLLPPEILEHYRDGGYTSRLIDWPEGAMLWDEDFTASTRENADLLTVSPQGTIIDRTTGRQPPFVCGFPFPRVDPRDPAAGVKILWNHYYGFWSQGSNRTVTMLNFVGRTGLERALSQDVRFLYYDGQPSWRRVASNPDNLLSQLLATTVSPTDLHGTTALTWRYRDSEKRDAVWAYVPALRRVRQVSPANRSDGFLGSDMSQDDGPFFDGKPEDFTWKLVGEAEVYRFCDPYSLGGKVDVRELDDGGWRMLLRDDPMVGYQDPRWEGLAWAPVSMALAKRECWIIEGVPKDRYYLYGKVQLYIDKETYQGAYNRKFDWNGELVNVYGVVGLLNMAPDGKNYFRGFATTWQGAENLKLGRATVAGPPPADWKDPPADYGIAPSPAFFDHRTLIRFGK